MFEFDFVFFLFNASVENNCFFFFFKNDTRQYEIYIYICVCIGFVDISKYFASLEKFHSVKKILESRTVEKYNEVERLKNNRPWTLFLIFFFLFFLFSYFFFFLSSFFLRLNTLREGIDRLN